MGPGRGWKDREHGRLTRDALLDALETFIRENGFSPTKEELAEIIGVSDMTIRRHVKKLIDEGVLEEGKSPRTLRFAL